MTPWDTDRWITTSDVERSRTSFDLDGLRRAVDVMRTAGTVNRFLDIGCGFGGLARLVGDHLGATEVHGVDIDPRVVDEVKSKDISLVLQDASAGSLPYEDGFFDAVMTLGMMDYLEYFDGVIPAKSAASPGPAARCWSRCRTWPAGTTGCCCCSGTSRATSRSRTRSSPAPPNARTAFRASSPPVTFTSRPCARSWS